jgi:TonB-linked SusC/RagA family outer membrane protein
MEIKALFAPALFSRRVLTKTWRIMRLTAVFFLAAGLTASASGFAQKVTLSEKNASLEKVFQEIKQQTGYEFLYTDEMLRPAARVTIDLKNVDLADALAACFRNQPLTYTIIERTVVVKEKKEILETVSPDTTSRRGVTVAGRVVDEKGEALAGASVETKNEKAATMTDAKGLFELKNVPVGTTLEVSFTGYQKKEVEVNDGVVFTVILALANNKLDEAEVIAYGSTTERMNTGNVSMVTAKEIEQQPVSNPLLALEGRVPGLSIVQATGMPGTGIAVRIQGQNSIFNGNDPFYVVDGVPYSSQPLQSLSPAGGNLAGSPFDFINPSDIESISVLKDADATAIYGSRAANGAILITTKKGKIGETKFDLNLQNGWGGITRSLPVLNTTQYLAMRHEAINNDGLTVQSTDYDLNGIWDTARNINWQKALLSGSSQYTNLNADVSGGNAVTQYFIGGTYNRQVTAFPGNFADQKASMHFNINTTSSNKKFRMELNGNYLFDNNQLPGSDLTPSAYTLAPDAPPLLNKDGSINWALSPGGNSTWTNSFNPMSYTLGKYINKNNNLIGNAVLSYRILQGLELRSSFGYNNLNVNEISTSPLSAVAPALRPYTNRSAAYTYNNNNSWIIEPQVDYQKSFDHLRLDALIGATVDQNNTNSLQLFGSGYNSDLVLEDPRSASSIIVGVTTASVYKYNAGFSRVNFNWDDKYLLNLTGRRDGSSRFGSANEVHDFWAIGAGWVFSKETTIQDKFSFLSFGKLKGSYGTTGSDQIGNYSYLNLYSPYGGVNPYQGIVALTPSGLTNPYLQWEETRKMEFGLDLGFMKDRILLNGTYVRNRSSNELLSYDLPSITGFESVSKNFPATVQNAEWEFMVSTVNVKSRHFSWSSHLNLTIPRNKLVAFPGFASSGYASIYVIGQPISGFNKLFHFLGVNDTTGIYQFASKTGPTSNPEYGTDNNVYINTNPKYYGGIANDFSYKGFELDILLQFVKKIGNNYVFGNWPGNIFTGNQPTYVLDRWQKQGDHAPIQRYSSGFSYVTQSQDAYISDGAYTDASFIRLKNLSLSYQLPGEWTRKAALKNLRIYLHAQNLLTITRYKGLDPEAAAGPSAGFPPIREITGGIQVAF